MPKRNCLKFVLILSAFFALFSFRDMLAYAKNGALIKAPDCQESELIKSRKNIFRNVLKGASCDVLIAPFQVSGNAIDRVGRSLMTRYLADRINRSSDLAVPSPTLIERALGDGARTIDDGEIYSLANELGARFLIKGFVAHNRKGAMNISLLIQTRQDAALFSSSTPAAKVEFSDIPFTDEFLPSDMFQLYLKKIIAKLPFETTAEPAALKLDDAEKLPFPESFRTMCDEENSSPVLNARYLQFLGILFPRQSREREILFEKSMVALSSVSSESSSYDLLRARALFYLHRRPAAVASLTEPKTPEDSAFYSYLFADLVGMEKYVPQVDSPLHRVMVEIELNHLRWKFEKELTKPEFYEETASLLPGWESLVLYRLQSQDPWNVLSNLYVKKEFDKTFPLPGVTAESLAASRLILDESPVSGEDIELSAFNHYRAALKSGDFNFLSNNDHARPVLIDFLDLLGVMGRNNLYRNVNRALNLQGIPDRALELLDLYEPYYRGDPVFAYDRASALMKASKARQESVRLAFREQALTQAINCFCWSGGQTAVADEAYEFIAENQDKIRPFSTYDSDFPVRYYWDLKGMGDRGMFSKADLAKANAASINVTTNATLDDWELALLYTHTGFWYFSNYVEGVQWSGNGQEEFIKANENRFAGHPEKIELLAGLRLKRGDRKGAKDIYRKAIDETPQLWQPYIELSNLFIEDNELDQARDLLLSYPPFAGEETQYRVAMTNRAFKAGDKFWQLGRIDHSLPFFNIAAEMNTGSYSMMTSRIRLLLLNEEYEHAAAILLEQAKRYESDKSYGDYMGLLHLTGLGRMSWALFDSIISKRNTLPLWNSALIGHRLEGKSNEEISQWYSRMSLIAAGGNNLGESMLSEGLIDRAPDQRLGENIKKISGADSPPAAFAEAYYLLRTGNYYESVNLFNRSVKAFIEESDLYDAALPYQLMAAVKADRQDLINLLVRAASRYKDFSYYLADAVVKGAKGKHAEALKQLEAAPLQISDVKAQPIPPAYQLVEICEWLYAESGKSDYLDIALYWAKVNQQTHPMESWAYAFEAKYSVLSKDRLKALALALYLDERSEWISKISDEEKTKAGEWLKQNNPFLKGDSEHEEQIEEKGI